MNLTLLV